MKLFLSALMAVAAAAVAAPSPAAALAQDVFVADTHEAFNEAFCDADRSGQSVFVVPLEEFTEERTLDCDFGVSQMRVEEVPNDPGHVIFHVDAPADVEDALDCDGMADVGMSHVAVNCLPSNMKSADHR
jgi:hypothetical protein